MKTLFKTTISILSISLLFACGQQPEASSSEKKSKEEVAEIKQPVNVKGEEVEYSDGETNMKGYIAYDDDLKGKRPGILVIHEWWGHGDYVRKRAEMLAELGYVGFALDMYGDGKHAEHPDDAKKYMSMTMANMDGAKARFDEAYKLLASDPHVDPENISVIGYCFGGAVALSMANAGEDLDGVAIFHSSVNVAIPPSDKLKAKVLVQNGADDPMIPAETIANFKSQMDELGADYEYISYAGAEHAYTNPGATELGEKFDMPISYNLEADTTSWNKLKIFLSDLYPAN